MRDTSIAVRVTEIRRMEVDLNLQHLQHVRLYPAGPTWANLQIRGKSPVSQSGKGKVWSWWSGAHLDYAQAVELRDALNEWIEDHKPTPAGQG